MRRWTAVILLVFAAGVSAQPPPDAVAAPTRDSDENGSTSEVSDETDSNDGALQPANVSTSETRDAQDDTNDTSATANDASSATPNDGTPNDGTPNAPNDGTPNDGTPNDGSRDASDRTTGSARELAPPIAPPPPRVGHDDERAPRAGVEPRPRSALQERFVIFTPGWMPIVTIGYRTQIVRYTGFTVDRRDTSHGLTTGVLAPVLATGDSRSRVRLALAIGMGLDVAWRSEESEETGPVIGPDGPISTTTSFVERTTYVYGQLAALLRVALGETSLLATVAWLPGKRFVEVDETSSFFGGVIAPSTVTALERARFSFGVLRVPFHVSAFVGAARVAALGTRSEIDLGLQLGMGW